MAQPVTKESASTGRIVDRRPARFPDRAVSRHDVRAAGQARGPFRGLGAGSARQAMITLLLLGLLLGMRHALEADHVAAVASLATQSKGMRRTVLQGAVWGLGHTLTLLAVGGACLLLRAAISARLAAALEGAVGVMLVLLGADVLLRMRRRHIHLHVHRHP